MKQLLRICVLHYGHWRCGYGRAAKPNIVYSGELGNGMAWIGGKILS